jgi:predicted PurR-regulated permease PerM
MFTPQNLKLPPIMIYGILGVVFYIIWLFNHSYITPLLLGLIFATLSYPFYQKIQSLFSNIPWLKKTSPISAITVLLIISGVLVLMLNFTARQFIQEIPNFTTNIIVFANQLPENQSVVDIGSKVGISQDYIREIVYNILRQTHQALSIFGNGSAKNNLVSKENINNVFNFGRQSLNILFNQLAYFIIFLLSWYNCLVYGKKWLDHIFEVLPFETKESQSIIKDFQNGVRNVIYANFLSGLIHAVICAIAMWIFGVQSIFILTIVIFLIGVLPLSPSELGYAIPVLLIFPSNPIFAILLAIVGEIVILWTNYILIPKIIASGKEGNTLLILTSILSGISIFGISGFIIGPLIIIFIQTLYGILVDRVGLKENQEEV